MKKRKPKPNQNGWQSNPDDAIKLAALRWFACSIEAEAIQIYATDSSKYEAIEDALRACINKVHGIKKGFTAGDDEDCPPGYVMCKTECAPMCLEDPASDT